MTGTAFTDASDLPADHGGAHTFSAGDPSSRDAARVAAQAQQALLAPLVARMAQADESALAEFYDATVKKVYGLALRICGSPAVAEEVVADTFFQAWTASARYEPSRGRVMAWLLVMARSRAIDAYHARDKAMPHEAPETLVEESDQPNTAGVDALLESMQSNAALQATLGRLSPVQRQLIALAFYQGLSHSEIATHIGLPLGTVKAHIRRALVTLRGALGDEPKQARLR